MVPNRRVLVVDDNPAIHQDFRKVLGPKQSQAQLEAMEALLFDETAAAPSDDGGFELTDALQGEEAVRRASEALRAGRPYALAFVDIRMPPGWDGVETASRLWEIDPRLQVVICSAYSDYSWEQMRERLGPRQQMLILKKPFDPIEVLQLAHALTEKWDLLLASKQTLAELESAVVARTASLESTHRKLVEAEGKLVHSQRLEALGRLAGGIAHEINNPLSFITSNLHFIDDLVRGLERPIPNSEDLGQAASDALVGAERIRRIVRDVRIFAQAEAAPLADVLLQTVAKRALELAQPEIDKRGTVSVKLEEGLRVVASEEGLVQVLYNLLANAAHALPQGKEASSEIHLTSTRAADGRVRIEVRDNGSGISADDLPHVFEPFFTTKPVGSGTGLGLCICHGIVTKLGGEMTVETMVGKGTTFRVVLPEPVAAKPTRALSSVLGLALPVTVSQAA